MIGFFRICRGITPDLGVRACVRALSPPNPNTFTAIPKDPMIVVRHGYLPGDKIRLNVSGYLSYKFHNQGEHLA
jgi:hypothetical protein